MTSPKRQGVGPVPKGFRFAGLHAGIGKKPSKPDLALFYSEKTAKACGVLTTNRVKAAPVLLSLKKFASGRARAIVANSGCANACTGEQGMWDAALMCDMAGSALGVPPGEVLVASTGVIGRFMPMDRVKSGIRAAAEKLSLGSAAGPAELSAVQAIMTTDTVPKFAGARFPIGGRTVTIWGCAKGAGMIHPDMATMLSFILTDADLPLSAMKKMLKDEADKSYNALSVDGDTSTNDSVFFLANGMSGAVLRSKGDLERFQTELGKVCFDLAARMASDGEGATKRIEITVRGARNAAEAKKVAATVATSPLVKTAFYGNDANWGRVIAAAGRSGAAVDPDRIDIYFDDLCVARNGAAQDFSEAKALRILKQKVVGLTIDLNQGKSVIRYLTCDFSNDYVNINAEYRT